MCLTLQIQLLLRSAVPWFSLRPKCLGDPGVSCPPGPVLFAGKAREGDEGFAGVCLRPQLEAEEMPAPLAIPPCSTVPETGCNSHRHHTLKYCSSQSEVSTRHPPANIVWVSRQISGTGPGACPASLWVHEDCLPAAGLAVPQTFAPTWHRCCCFLWIEANCLWKRS